ncbi:MAG: Hpt domain-containing protein [Pseudomonadota bacterium]
MTQSIDSDNLEMLKEVMEDEFGLLLQTYIEDCQSRIPQMKEQLAGTKVDELRRNAHSLKGSSSNIGAIPLSDLARQLEDLAAAGGLEGASELVDQISIEFETVHEALKAFL